MSERGLNSLWSRRRDTPVRNDRVKRWSVYMPERRWLVTVARTALAGAAGPPLRARR